MSRQHIAATNRFVCTVEFLWKSFSLPKNLSPQHVAQIQSDLSFCDFCSDQILLRRQRFHKNSPVHTKRFVAATCRLTLLLQLVPRPVHTEWSVAATCCSNLSPRLLHQYKWNTIQIRLPRLIIKAPYGLNVMTRPFLTFSQVPCREGRREVVLALIKDALYWPLPL